MTALDDACAAAATGQVPDPVALMRILMEAPSQETARDALSAATAMHLSQGDCNAVNTLNRIAALWARTPSAWDTVRGTIAQIAHRRSGTTPDAVLAYWAERFDALVAAQPVASVALYSLGDPALLAASTGEIVDRMAAWSLLHPATRVLDIGCGIGRFLTALAPRVARVTGLDLSGKMVAEARRRCAGFGTVSVQQTGGRDLAGIADRSVDLVLAVDVFPYLVEAGGDLARIHVAEAARVLEPGGALLILNYSYRGEPDADHADVLSHAKAAGLTVARAGTRDFRLWDGITFLLRRLSDGD